jgi:hypothetical protein
MIAVITACRILALGRSGAGCRKIAHPAPHGPTLDQQSQTAFRRKSFFLRERTLPSRLPLAVKTALRNDGWRKKARWLLMLVLMLNHKRLNNGDESLLLASRQG